jgi:uncharacterized membrane protein YgaE (UPF0421/DUF939 family)
MVKLIQSNRPKGFLTLEISKSEIEDILWSLDTMIERQQRTLLENLPSTEEERRRVDKYKQLREDFRKVMQNI